MRTTVHVQDAFRPLQAAFHASHRPDQVAAFAMELVERWALVAALPDGEDSAGRSKLRVATVDEITARSFDIAEAVFAEAGKRGLLIEMPEWDAMQDMARDARGKN